MANTRPIQIPFVKMAGAGNDFLIVDARRRQPSAVARRWADVARAVCHRQHGIGANGLLVIEPSRKAEARMRIFNSDGSEAEMCGNGARCAAWFIAQSARSGARVRRLTLETQPGILTAEVRADHVRIQLSDPTELRRGLSVRVDGRSVPLSFINTGVPHAVVPVSSLETTDVPALGRALRFHQTFAPRGANVNFIESHGPTRLRIRTYERGVEGETLACGTGVTAAAVLHALDHLPATGANGGRTRRVEVRTRGGDTLTVELTVAGDARSPRIGPVFLEGAVRWIGEGSVAWQPTEHR